MSSTATDRIKSHRGPANEEVARMLARKRQREQVNSPPVAPDVRPESVRYSVLGKLCAEHRERECLSLRDAERLTGVSASTLSRLENGKTVESNHLIILCKWLSISVESIAGEVPTDTAQAVKALLLADPKLGREEAEALCQMFGVLYRQMAQSDHV